MINTFSSVVGHELPYEIVERRPVGVVACYASVKKATFMKCATAHGSGNV